MSFRRALAVWSGKLPEHSRYHATLESSTYLLEPAFGFRMNEIAISISLSSYRLESNWKRESKWLTSKQAGRQASRRLGVCSIRAQSKPGPRRSKGKDGKNKLITHILLLLVLPETGIMMMQLLRQMGPFLLGSSPSRVVECQIYGLKCENACLLACQVCWVICLASMISSQPRYNYTVPFCKMDGWLALK